MPYYVILRMLSKIIYSVILSFLIVSCKNNSPELKLENAITTLTNKFPQLIQGENANSEFFKLIRSVKNGKYNFQIHLLTTPDSLEDPQQIIVFINEKGAYHAIPFFSNTYRDYWNFKFDQPLTNTKRANSTFNKELLSAIDTLNLNYDFKIWMAIRDELFISLLQCKRITETDEKVFRRYMQTYSKDVPPEVVDSCYARGTKNFNAVIKDFFPNDTIIDNVVMHLTIDYNAYYDEQNQRIYQLDANYVKERGILELNIKNYRQDCYTLSPNSLNRR